MCGLERPLGEVLDLTGLLRHYLRTEIAELSANGVRLRFIGLLVAVVLLVGLEEMSYEQAAGTLGIPIGTVMSRLARGRERLRGLLSGSAGPALRRVK